MVENKLVVVVMGPGKKHFAEMCLDSVKDADSISYWTNNKEFMFKYSDSKFYNDVIFYNDWDEKDPATNGKCRNRYLKYLKENHPNDWCLVLDEDELVEDLDKVKQFIQDAKPGIYNVKMRHFIGDLGHEDAITPTHVVPGRLFKISEAKGYPEHSHPVLQGELMGACLDTTIWHLGHLAVDYMDYILMRYKQHSADSKIHTQQFLKQWKMSHLLGQYPFLQINPVELPKQICDRYELDKDEFYFMNRGLETKHFIDAIHWRDFFKCKTALEWGAGRGPRVYAMNQVGIDTLGIEISHFAVNNAIDNQNIIKGDILEYKRNVGLADLTIAYDVLEHIHYVDLEKAIENIIIQSKKYILISVPILGDPNLDADPTHKIRENKEWWIKQFTDEGLKLIKTPDHFLFKEQVMIFEK